MKTSSRYKAFATATGSAISYSLNAVIYSLVVIFITPVCKAINASLTQFQLVLTMIGLGMVISNLFVGEILKKYNPKFICAISALGATALYACIALANSIYIIWFGSLIFGILYGGCGQTLLNIMITGWFKQGSGTLIGISTTISNLLSVFASPFAAQMIVTFGYQKVALFLAIVLPAIVIISSLFLIFQLPSKYGVQPISFGKKKNKKTNNIVETKMGLAQMAKTPAFILVFIGVTLITIATAMYFNNSVPIFQSKGLSYLVASRFVGVVAAAGMVAVTVLGWLSDHLGARFALVLYCFIAMIDMFIFPLLKGQIGCLIFAILVSATQCCYMYAPLTLPKLFGPETSAPSLGWIGIANGVGSMIGGPLASYLEQQTGSFSLPLMIGGIFFLLMILVTIFVTSTRTASKIKKEANF